MAVEVLTASRNALRGSYGQIRFFAGGKTPRRRNGASAAAG